MMKKIKILLATLIVAWTMTSCVDNSGQYVGQLYTTAQKHAAVKECLVQSKDSALNHLFVDNGFYNYNDGAYRIDYSALAAALMDTLSQHGLGYLNDSLIVATNHLATNCRSAMSDALTTAINEMEYWDYDGLIGGSDDAITQYFKKFKNDDLKAALQSPVSIRMNVFNVNNIWNEMVAQYYSICGTPVGADVQGYIINKMLDGVYLEMMEEEYLIRTDTNHQNENTILFR